jgi:hypothetical protein
MRELLSTTRVAIQNYPSRCDWLRKDDTMTEVTMTSAMTSTAAR